MQHGVPISGFLYRKVAESLPQDQFRILMPTLVGLGFSSKAPASQHSIENYLSGQDMTVEIVWGMNDQRLGDRPVNMQGVFPNAAVVQQKRDIFCKKRCPTKLRQPAKIN